MENKMKLNINILKDIRKGKYRVLNKTENKISLGWYHNENDYQWHAFESMRLQDYFQNIKNQYESWQV